MMWHFTWYNNCWIFGYALLLNFRIKILAKFVFIFRNYWQTPRYRKGILNQLLSMFKMWFRKVSNVVDLLFGRRYWASWFTFKSSSLFKQHLLFESSRCHSCGIILFHAGCWVTKEQRPSNSVLILYPVDDHYRFDFNWSPAWYGCM